MSTAVRAYIGLGANLGFAVDAVKNALVDLSHLPQTEFESASSLYRSEAIGDDGPDYINAVAEVTTELTPLELLATLFAIERSHGRVRTTRNAPRTLDLDLLLYGDAIIDTPELTLPHPRLTERAFVLLPLVELAPEITIPGAGLAATLLSQLGEQRVERMTFE